MDVSIIVALAENGVIGRGGELPWRLPADLEHFKSTTMGKPIVMGRHTHESIGRPLPGRENIVLTSDPEYRAPGCRIVHKLDEIYPGIIADEIMIIGGARLYAETLPLAVRLYMTEVHARVEGDVSFPDFDPQDWDEISRQFYKADDRNEFDYSFVVLERRQDSGLKSSC